MLLAPDFTIVDANETYLATTMRSRGDLVGRNMFDAFPAGPGDPGGANVRILRDSLERAVHGAVPDTLALIKYDIPKSGGAGETLYEERYWSATHTPLFGPSGEVAYVLQHTVDVTELQRLKSALHGGTASRAGGAAIAGIETGVMRRAEAVQQENRALVAERTHLRRLFEQAPGFMAVLTGPDYVFELANRAYLELIGRRDILGETIRAVLPEVVDQGFITLLDTVSRSGEPFIGESVRVLLQRQAGAPPEERFVDFIYQPIVEADGTYSGMFVQGHDVTERKRAEDRQKLLVDELNHRVKNTLATVQSMAAQTARSTVSPELFTKTFEARVIALSKTHNVLTDGHWESAGLHELLKQELSHFGESRISLSGIPVRLKARSALTLGMTFHELATNAAKYGALSIPAGVVTVSWAIEAGSESPEPSLRIRWAEQGGPKVQDPTRRGFGSRLIERAVKDELGGFVDMSFRAEGLHCILEVPVRWTEAV